MKRAQVLRSTRFIQPLFLLILLMLSMVSTLHALNLFWDAGNTNNGAQIDPGSGNWDVYYLTTNLVNATSSVSTNDNALGAGGIDWFQVNVPPNAVAATNILLYATNLPVNVWFSPNVPPTTNGVGDALLMPGVTSGVSILTTTSAPANIVQGGTYYLGIDNTANNNAVGYALTVDFWLTNAVAIDNTNLNWNNGSGNTNWTQTSTTGPTQGATFNGPDAAANTYQVVVDNGQVSATNLTINASGYAFSGSPVYLNLATPLLFIADGKSVTFSNNLTGNNSTSELRMGNNGAPATVVLDGTMTGFQPLFSSTNGSLFYLAGSGINSSGTAHVNANVLMTNGTYNSTGAFVIGRQRPGQTQPLNDTGTFTLGGTAIFNQSSDYISLGRDSFWNSTLII